MNYLIHSFSNHLLNEEIKKIIKDETNITHLYMDDVSVNDLINECAHASLFNDKRIVVAYNFRLSTLNESLTNYLNNSNENTTLILITNRVDKRTKAYKEIKDIVNFIDISIPFPASRKRDIENYKVKILKEYTRNNNINTNDYNLKLILNNNLDNIDLSISELNKFSIVSNTVDTELINNYSHVIKETDSFYLIELILTKKKEEFFKEFETIENSKEEIYSFTALLASQLRIMYYSYILNKSVYELSKILKVHSFRVERSNYFNTFFTKEEVENFLIKLGEFDYKIKTNVVNEYTLFKNIIATL